MSTPTPTPAQRAEFRQKAVAVADRICAALDGEQESFVVLEGLCLVHKFVASKLPPELLGHVAFAMAGYAGELMQARSTGLNPKPAIH
ncbi:MAG: hypothetical protein F9K35_01560 [Burkholderiaceae bacterium]|nr:MAG: hypothetical protein F9K35_01560 [Burkholderiaceae bacterium]